MNLAPLVALAALAAGCASDAVLVARPADGYAAIRVRQTFEMRRGVIGGHYEAPVGTVLVQDRALRTGEPLFCGELIMVSLGRTKDFVCVARRGTRLTLNPDRGGGELLTNDVPEGALIDTRVP